ncbi:DNA-binding response regulator [Streptomyces sp. NRRL F-5123]|uniref:DNA-binding response regulator n=1 Tax=Streptomyces sp. NRRL F-5123 TaxID=1463856 RepID=UPI00131C318E|nr:DNA-binding response regulator [Streptomyces sp. NRRL F-5123]
MVIDECMDDVDFRILALMREGLSDATIGRKLSRGHRTIQRRICHMMDSLGVSGRFALGLKVAELNLLAARELPGHAADLGGTAAASTFT